jgi:hypothetical protein
MVLIASTSAEGAIPEIRVATPLIVLGSVVVFAVTVGSFGLLPAAFLATLTAAFADLSFRPLRNIALAALLTVLAYLVFSAGLRLPLPLFAWPL